MNDTLPTVWLARHGETAWGISGRHFVLATGSLSALGYDHDLSEPAIQLWNDTRHVGPWRTP